LVVTEVQIKKYGLGKVLISFLIKACVNSNEYELYRTQESLSVLIQEYVDVS